MANTATSIKPWVERDVFVGILWGGEAIGSIFIFLRLFIRFRAFRKFWPDDYIIMFVWICSLSICILWQMIVEGLYNQYKLTTGELPLTADVIQKELDLLRGSGAFLMLWHTCIYSIKAAFLIFFRRLDQLHHGARNKWWWFVSIFTFASGMSSIGMIYWRCLLSSLEYIFTQCSNGPALRYQHLTFIFSCVLDVVSDSLIISIPVIMLWNVHVRLGKKLALMGLFSLTIIVMATAVTRVAVIPTEHTQADVSWLYLWYNIELFTALLVSSLASFRQLYITQSGRPSANSNQRTRSTNSNIIFKGSFRVPQSLVSASKPSQKAPSCEDDILPLSSIHVSHDVDISTIPSKSSK